METQCTDENVVLTPVRKMSIAEQLSMLNTDEALEISVVSIGWYLGGTVGVGTLLFAFGIGPCVALGLFLVDKIFD